MNIKKSIIVILLSLGVVGVGIAVFKTTIKKPFFGEEWEDLPSGFQSSVMLRMTPVKDQGMSNLCWAYAMLATIETTHLMQEDSVNLSPDYVGRMYLEEQAMERFRSNGEHEISMRGMGPMAITLIEKYGVVPYDSYFPQEPVNYNVLQRKVSKTIDIALAHHYSKEKCLENVRNQLDNEIGSLPQAVYMFGMEYTFLEFAHSVCMPDEYKALTSMSSCEYGKMIELPFEDNHYHCKALNIEPDLLISEIESALRRQQAVMWEGGPNDNHAVCIVGMGKDKSGTEYFIAKNSWGVNNPTHGLLYIPKDYVRTHTAVALTRK